MSTYSDDKFDWQFYVNYYKDLQKANINTKDKALKHWLRFGRREGRICNFALKFVFELYIKNLTDDTIDTYDKAYKHFSTIGSTIYNDKMALLGKLNITDVNYYYELKSFIEAYNDYGFNGLNINQIFNMIQQNPKIEFRYFCYRYLDYIRTFQIPDVAIGTKKEAVLIEFRKFPHLEFLIRNTIIKLPKDWSHTVICGEDNYDLIVQMCTKISDKIRIKKYPYKNLSVNQYSLLLSSKEFWQDLTGEKILIYQDDSCIFKSNIDDFLDFDYIGAPWPKHQNDNSLLVGNGGFSLRSRDVMIKVIDTISIMNATYNSSTLEYMKNANIQVPPEDVYFSKNIIELQLGKVADYNTANKFSVETQFSADPFAGHNFWISMKNWKEHMYKCVCIQVCPPANLVNMLSYYLHRGGWKYVLCNLFKNDIYNKNSNINLIDIVEHFVHGGEKQLVFPKFDKLNGKYIGIIHGTNLGRFDKDPCWLKNVLDKSSKFMSDINKFIAIFTFSEYAKKYISDIFNKNMIQIPIYVLSHPVSFNIQAVFDPGKFTTNNDKKIIQLGQQLRYHSAIYRINTKYKKLWLPGFNNKEQAHQFVRHELWEQEIKQAINFNDVEILYLDNYQEYDNLLEKNIVLIYVKDANANNSVLECIARNTPFITNKHPAIVEYVGENYPLFFNKVDEIPELLSDDKIIQGYTYLSNLNKSKFNISFFLSCLLTNIHK